ncbi:MAG: hypothetical protein ACRCY8_16975 [Dermatophilaceae bacterium]
MRAWRHLGKPLDGPLVSRRSALPAVDIVTPVERAAAAALRPGRALLATWAGIVVVLASTGLGVPAAVAASGGVLVTWSAVLAVAAHLPYRPPTSVLAVRWLGLLRGLFAVTLFGAAAVYGETVAQRMTAAAGRPELDRVEIMVSAVAEPLAVAAVVIPWLLSMRVAMDVIAQRDRVPDAACEVRYRLGRWFGELVPRRTSARLGSWVESFVVVASRWYVALVTCYLAPVVIVSVVAF